MSTNVIYNTPAQPATPGVINLTGGTAPIVSAVPLPGTNTGSGSAPTTLQVVPIATPVPPTAAALVPIATPNPPPAPGITVVSLPNGAELPSMVTQGQLQQAVNTLNTTIAAGTKPIITKPDGTKVTLTIDDNDVIGDAPVAG
jgi:hypothetical protein